ncbi:ParA family protein [Falsiroseomonas sp. CW058]|uniref:ParA family protein n=1 Tax=Falsiroseomonas sp. CW058 TaxID=3388664 RepID=UPI003D31E471
MTKDTEILARRRVLVVASPKGGVGKSSLSRNILVSAVMAGFRVIGADLNPQQTLWKWHERREKMRASFPEVMTAPVTLGTLGDWRKTVALVEDYDLVVIDTPPSIETHYGVMINLCAAAHHVLVPCGATLDDVDSVTPWMRTLTAAKVPASFVMNRVNNRVNSFKTYQTKLLAVGQLCPVAVPQIEDVHLSAAKGLAVPDLISRRHQETFDALWSYVAREVGLPVSEASLSADPRATAPPPNRKTSEAIAAVEQSENAKGLAIAAALVQLVEGISHDLGKRVAAVHAQMDAIINKE